MGAHRAKENANYMQLIRTKINLGIFFYYDDFFRNKNKEVIITGVGNIL